MATRKFRRFAVLLLAGLPVFYLAYSAYLNFIGYCPEKGRVLTEQEKLAPVIMYLALAHPVPVEPPKIPPRETRLYYDSIEEFVRDNPDCCHVVKEFYTNETGWVRLGLWPRLCGFVSDYVSVKFYRRYQDKQGVVRKELAEGGYALTPCGKIVDFIDFI